MDPANIAALFYGIVAATLTGAFYMLWQKEKTKTCCSCDNWTFTQQYDTYKMLLNSQDIKNACQQNPDKTNSIAACLTETISKTAGNYNLWKKGLGPLNPGYYPSLLTDCVQSLCR